LFSPNDEHGNTKEHHGDHPLPSLAGKTPDDLINKRQRDERNHEIKHATPAPAPDKSPDPYEHRYQYDEFHAVISVRD